MNPLINDTYCNQLKPRLSKTQITKSDAMTWRIYPPYWFFDTAIHWSLVVSPRKGPLIWSFDIFAINLRKVSKNPWVAGDLRCRDVTAIILVSPRHGPPMDLSDINASYPNRGDARLIYDIIQLLHLHFYQDNHLRRRQILLHSNTATSSKVTRASNTMNNQSALWILMAWCFSTRASLSTVLSAHSWISNSLWVNMRFSIVVETCVKLGQYKKNM